MRLVTDRYEARYARHTLLPLTKLDEVDKTVQRQFRVLVIGVSIVDLGLSPHGDPQHLREPGAQQGSRDCHLARKRFRNEDSGGVGFTIIGFPQIPDVPMRHAVARDLRALLGQRLAAPVRIHVDARTKMDECQRTLRYPQTTDQRPLALPRL